MNDTICIIFFIIMIIMIFMWQNIIDFIFHKREIKDHFTNEGSSVIFLTQNETQKIILDDKDNYYSTFFIYDYLARKVKSLDEYKDKIKNSPKELNENQKKRITKLISEIDNQLLSYPYSYSYFSPKKCSKIKWKIGYTEGRNYEGGLPHTRGDIIMITNYVLDQSDEDLKGTLLHEKIHIYQKKNMDESEKYIEEHKYRRWKRRDEQDRVRANPDTDDYIYMNSKGEICKSVYNQNPKDLEDTKTYPNDSQESEHPLENMAITLEKLILSHL